MYYSQETKDRRVRLIPRRSKTLRRKKRKTNASRFPCRNESFSRLLNLERDIPKEGRLGDNPPVKGQLDEAPLARVLSLVTRGDF